ncbi:DUF4012 domain-containing protein [Nocardioides sp. cx-173]|uniref:DUF4012 domain-containing protein n=1 Tax=Nocardioides sp. cx-173 TaxID=2898796 RepID=UPI001E374646|nr:DUF4012 domain-containing protein [Nocardioides sp. cx-173]UGB41903.1 DUF4012 domain-containing protein [Nocardioides sp. cx-173]
MQTTSEPSSRRRRIVIGLWVLFALGAALLALAIPLRNVPGEAEAANDDLTAAKTALAAGDMTAARAALASAQEHVDKAQDAAQGFGGDVWSRIPLLGTPVADARHLVQALDDVAAVAAIGVDLYPSVAGKQASLFRDGQVERATLDRVIAGAREAGPFLKSAQRELEEVRGNTPILGSTISARRDAAAEQVNPLADGFTRLEPLLDELPAFLGFEGKRSYLIAMLNPTELRYSGGAALAFAPMAWEGGTLEIGRAFPSTQDPRLLVPHKWEPVRGNTFHAENARLANATFAPSWSVSGEELLRAWRSATGVRYDGVMAMDVVTMAKVLEATGPTTVPGVGELNGDNLTETLVGSYDDYYPDPTAQDQAFATVVAALQTQLFSDGDYVAKAQALKQAADGRHFAIYLKDKQLQLAFGEMGMDGDLADSPGDYVGAFTQSLVGAKVDYYQRRELDLDVTLDEDGTATNELDVLLLNDTPPYAVPGTDPREGYFTRWSTLSVAAFLPASADVEDFSVGDQEWDGEVGTFFDHTFIDDHVVLPPGGSTHVKASYTVDAAAELDESGDLVYRLAIDPQGTVYSASVQVTVHLPKDFRAKTVPAGWTEEGATLTFHTDALESSEQWEIVLED